MVYAKNGHNVVIKKAWIIKDKKNQEAKALIAAACDTKDSKEEVMSKKSSLKEEVYINNDLTWIERKNKNIVYLKAKELQAEGGEKPKMKNNKVEKKRKFGSGVKGKRDGFGKKRKKSKMKHTKVEGSENNLLEHKRIGKHEE